MRREDIPARLRVTRAADVAKIPFAALKSMTPADVAPRLLAADEYRRRARVPHLDGDLLAYRLGLAREVLETGDPKRAAELIAKAGVQTGVHEPFTGRHTHAHADNGVRGGASVLHEHEHSHDGDASHIHVHGSSGRRAAPPPTPAGKSVAVAGALAKSAAPQPSWDISQGDGSPFVRVNVPVLDGIASDSGKIIALAGTAGQLGAMAREIGQLEKANAASAANLPGKAAHWEQLAKATPDPVQAAQYRQMARDAREQLTSDTDHLAKAADYEAKAARMASAQDRGTYLDLARAEREKAGAL